MHQVQHYLAGHFEPAQDWIETNAGMPVPQTTHAEWTHIKKGELHGKVLDLEADGTGRLDCVPEDDLLYSQCYAPLINADAHRRLQSLQVDIGNLFQGRDSSIAVEDPTFPKNDYLSDD